MHASSKGEVYVYWGKIESKSVDRIVVIDVENADSVSLEDAGWVRYGGVDCLCWH